MKQIKGIVKNIDKVILGTYTTHNNIFQNNKILFCNKKPLFNCGINAYIVPKGKSFKTNKTIIEVENTTPFIEKDIINISPNGLATVVWEADTPHHALYVTDVCNSKCIMCPQIEGASAHYDECIQILDLVDTKNVSNIGITGGEPTLNINKLVEILEKIAKKSPNQKVHILTNGRNFARIDVVEKLASIRNIDISYGIPLYSDIAEEHDFIVGVNGAFNETMQGIYNLGKHNQKVEIRTVILRQNYKKLRAIAIIEYELPDKARVDIMATIDGIDYAIEVDFSRGSKIYECIGQSLYYALSTNRKAGALLVIEEPKDYFYFERFKKVADKYGIRYWIITPEDLKTESQTNEL